MSSSYGVQAERERKFRPISFFLIFAFLLQLIPATVFADPVPAKSSRAVPLSNPMDGIKEYFPDTVGLENPREQGSSIDESENPTWFKRPSAISPDEENLQAEPVPQSEGLKPKRYQVPERKSESEAVKTDPKTEHPAPVSQKKESGKSNSSPNVSHEQSSHSDSEEKNSGNKSGQNPGGSSENSHRDNDKSEKDDLHSDKDHKNRDHGEHCEEHNSSIRRHQQPISVVLAPSQLTVPSQPWSRLTSPRSPYFSISQDPLVAYQNDYAVVASRKYENLSQPGKDEIIWDLISPDTTKNRTSRHSTGSIRFRLRNYGKGLTDKDSHHTIEVRIWDQRTPNGREMKIIDEPTHLRMYQAVAGFSTIDIGNYQFIETRNGSILANETLTVNSIPEPNAEWVTRVLGKYSTIVAPFAAWTNDEWFVRKKEYVFHDPNAGTPTAKTLRVEWNWSAPPSSKLNRTKFGTYLTVKYNYWTDGSNYRLVTNVFDTLYPKGRIIKVQEGSGTLSYATLTYGVGLPTFGDFCIQERIDGVETECFALSSRFLSATADMPIIGYADNGPLPIQIQVLTAPTNYIIPKFKWKLNIKDDATGTVLRKLSGEVTGNDKSLINLQQNWDWKDDSGNSVAMGTIVATELTIDVPRDPAAALAALPQCTKDRQAGIRPVPQCQKRRIIKRKPRTVQSPKGGQSGSAGGSGDSSEEESPSLLAQIEEAIWGVPGDVWVLASEDPAIGVIHSARMIVYKNQPEFQGVSVFPDPIYKYYETPTVFGLAYEDRRADSPVTLTNSPTGKLSSLALAFRTDTGERTGGFTSKYVLHNLTAGYTLPLTDVYGVDPKYPIVDNPEVEYLDIYYSASGYYEWIARANEAILPVTTITTISSTRTAITSAGTNGAVGSRQTLNGETPAPVRMIRPNGLYDSVYTDIAVNTGDFPLVIRRHWNPGTSFDADENFANTLAEGRYQWGWVYNFQRDLFISADRGKVIYRKPEGGLDVYNRDSSGVYKAARADDTKVLTRNGMEFYLTEKSGHSYRFRLVEDLNTPVRAYLFEEKDANNNKLTYTYHDKRQLFVQSITSTHGQSLKLYWNTDLLSPIGLRYAELSSVIDDSGRRVQYTYQRLPAPLDFLSILSSVQQPGRTLSYGYTFDPFSKQANARRPMPDWASNTPDNLRYYESIANAFGRFTLATVSLNGQVQTSLVGLDKFPAILDQVARPGVRQYSYTQPSGSSRLLSVIAANGTGSQTWRHEIDSAHRITKSTDPNGFSEQFSHDDAQNLIAHVDKTGQIKSFAYDANRNLIKATDSLGRETSYTYDSNNNLTEVKNPYGKTQRMTWDGPRHLMLTHTDEENHTQTYQYDNYGNLTKHRTALGYEWTLAYDPAKFLLVSRTAPGGATWTYTNDLLARRTQSVTPSGHLVSRTYDVRDRVVRVDDAGRVSTSEYNANDQIVRITDPLGRTVTTEYDTFWRPTATVQADRSVIRQSYDDFDNVVSVTNSIGATTTYTYDKLNRILSTTYPSPAGRESYQYNDRGEMVQWTKSDNSVLNYEFDAVGNLLKVKSGSLDLLSFDYDSLNRVTTRTQKDTAVGASRSTNYTYSDSSNLTSVADNLGRTITYSYDDDNRVTKMTDPEGKTMTYGLDARNQLVSASTDGLSATYAYNPVGTLNSINYSNGVRCALNYDSLDRLTQKTYRWQGDPLVSHSYTYDAVDRKKSHRLVLPAAVCTRNYNYNQIDQLISTVQNYRPALGTLTTTTTDYTLDSNNNIKNIVSQPGNHRVLSVNQADQTTSDSTRFQQSFDAAGSVSVRNSTGEPTSQMKYDYKDQMTEWRQGAQNLIFQYDASNRLEKRTLNGQKTEFLWDGEQLYKEYDNDGAARSRYFLGFEREAVFMDGSWHLLLTDALGSVHAVTNAAGNLESSRIYNDYGQVEHTFGTTNIPYGWQGQRVDSVTGLHYMRNRWYDSNSCKFTARDPIRYGAGLNMYAFCSGDPINHTDPSGLDGDDDNDSPTMQEISGAVYRGTVSTIQYGKDVVRLGGTAARNAPGTASRNLWRITPGGATVQFWFLLAKPTGEVDPLPDITENKRIEEPTKPDPAEDQVFYRFGSSWESTGRIKSQCERACAGGFPYGLSINLRPPANGDFSVSTRSVLNAAGFFPVKTGRDSGHFTVPFQDPVTPEQARAFNTAFGRRR